MARSAQHEVQVEQNHNGAVFLCTLRQKFQIICIRMGPGRCIFSLFSPFKVTPFKATMVTFWGFNTFYGKNGQYNTNPVFEDLLSNNGYQTFSLIIHGIKHIARRAYSGYGFYNLHPALFAIWTLVNIELR